MPTAIGPSPYLASTGIASPRGLGAQLDQCRKQLADLENCSTGKTPAGQAKIADLSGRISALERRIESSGSSGNPLPPAEINRPAVAGPESSASPATAGYVGAGQRSPSLETAGGTIGVHLDVYA